MLQNNINVRCQLVTPKPVKVGDVLYYNRHGQFTTDVQNSEPVAVALSNMDSDGFVLMKFDDSTFLPNTMISGSGACFSTPQFKTRETKVAPLNIEDFVVQVRDAPSIDNISKVK